MRYTNNQLHEEIVLIKQKLNEFIADQNIFNKNHMGHHEQREKNIKWWIGTSLVTVGIFVTILNLILNLMR